MGGREVKGGRGRYGRGEMRRGGDVGNLKKKGGEEVRDGENG